MAPTMERAFWRGSWIPWPSWEERYLSWAWEMKETLGGIHRGGCAAGPGGQLDGSEARIQLSVAPYEGGFGLQLWKSYEACHFEITLSNPGKTVTERISSRGPL